MDDYGLLPEPPKWALDAGLTLPRTGETFSQYVERLGLSCPELLDELTERTICLANLRLATRLQYEMPGIFRRHVADLVRRHVPPERIVELEKLRPSFVA